MANIDFDDILQDGGQPSHVTDSEQAAFDDTQPSETQVPAQTAIGGDTMANGGLSAAEMNDPNAIRVTIEDADTPIVVLFGPPASGKTMTLIRLARYLREKNYTVSPIPTFRPARDEHYKRMCTQFNEMVTSDKAAESTQQISFMLLKVLKNGRPKCQILEAPGEHYFDPNDKSANKNFPKYINNIMNNKNRKIWLFIVEPDWKDAADRSNYVERIKQVRKKMRPIDKAIFLFNKIDTTDFVISRGKTNTKEAIKFVGDQYCGIFKPFENQNPITRFFSRYNCSFIPFSTGDYNTTTAGGKSFEPGPDEYPRDLWSAILKYVNG